MQFRVQAKKLQFIRSVYNPQTKRCDQKLVGSISSYTDKMPSDDSIKMLSDDERNQLSDYLTKKADTNKSDYQRRIVQSISYSINSATDAILADEPLTIDLANKIWESVARLTKALKKTGHPKPTKPLTPDSTGIHNPTAPGLF